MSDISIIHGPTNWSTLLLAPLRTALKGVVVFQVAFRQAALANKLYDLSDNELAKRGLTRDQIPHFVLHNAP